MADNYTFTEGSGKTGASDDIAGTHYPRVKVSWGADGSAADASVADPFPVRATAGTIGNGRKTITAADTPETLVGSSTPCLAVIVQALPGNTSWVSIGGGSSTDAQGNSTFSGLILASGESSPPLPVDNVQKVYVDADVSGEGVTFLYWAA